MTVVRVYSRPDCVQCIATKRRLTEKGIVYVPEDIDDPGNLAAAKSLGFMSAPVVVAGDKAWAGYQPDRIDELAASMEGTI